MLPSLLIACDSGSFTGPTGGAPPVDSPAPSTPTPAPAPAPTDPTVPTTPTVEVGALVFDDAVPRNLLYVSLDTTRRDAIGRYAGTADTPILDGFLAESFVLDDHRSCGNWTGPAMTCAISGRNPMEMGFWPGIDDDAVPRDPPTDYPTLATYLGRAGVQTVVVTSNHVFSSQTGIDAGFDREVREDWTPADNVADSAIREAQVLADQPEAWYLHVHFIDPHGGYCPPEGFYDFSGIPDIEYSAGDLCSESYELGVGYDGEPWDEALVDSLLELYLGELRYWDQTFGRFIDELDQRGILDDTLVVFVTDHGQQFFERGAHGHGKSLGSEENRAAAAFWAKNLHPGAWTGVTVHQDIVETLFQAYGIVPEPPTSGMLVGSGTENRPVRAMNSWGPTGGVRLSIVKGKRQLLYDWWGERALYRLESDPGGLVDLYDPTDPDVIDLWTDMDDWIAEVQAEWPHYGDPTQPGP